MNLNLPDTTEAVKSENYTNKFLQKNSTTTTMKVVTQTNAVKSPTDSPKTTKLVYTVEEIARMLAISLRSATNGRAFPPKRRQRTERNKSSTSWQREPS